MFGILVAAFILGSIVGSFLNVCIHRLPRDLSIRFPPSHCPSCKTLIRPIDNIPILSYLMLVGRCRRCRVRISWRYPFVEALNGAAYVLVVWHFGVSAAAVAYATLLSALIVITFIDLAHQIIPNEISLPGIAVGFLAAVTVLPISWVDSLAGLALGGTLLFLIVWLSPYIFGREGMGMGDVKLLAMLGAFLGWKSTLLTLFIGAFSGSVVGLLCMASRVIKRTEPIPFGPFLALGAVISLFWGQELVEWYRSWFAVSPRRL